MALVGNNPTLLTIQDAGSFSERVVLYQFDWVGLTWGAKQSVTGTQEFDLSDVDLLDLGGKPFVGWMTRGHPDSYYHLNLALADDAGGTSFDSPRVLDPLLGHDFRLLKLAGGEPLALCGRSYQDPNQGYAVGSLNGLNWPAAATALGPEGHGGNAAACLYDGKPLLADVSFTKGLYVRSALDAAATTWGPPTLLDAAVSYDPQPVLLRSSGIPVVLAYDNDTQTLRSYNYKPF